MFDLLSAFSNVLMHISKEEFYEVVRDEVTVEQKVHELLHLLVQRQHLSFQELFATAQSRLAMIATFLALLELVRLREVVARQDTPFGPIMIVRRDDAMQPTVKTA